jgi:hypothetical protein
MHHYFTYNPELERINHELNQAVFNQKEKEYYGLTKGG